MPRVFGSVDIHGFLPRIPWEDFFHNHDGEQFILRTAQRDLTVKTQALSVYRKLDVSSRSEAVERGRVAGLIDD